MTKPIRHMTTTVQAALLLVFLAAASESSAHGGDDHGDAAPAPAHAPGVEADLLVASGATEQFELLLKYAPPHIDTDARVRLFLADYATNRAIEGAAFTLAFKPAGVVIVRAPTMVSPGIYDAVVRFPRDTIYNLVATVVAGERTDFLEVRTIYAGEAAARIIAQHAPPERAASTASSVPWWSIGAVVTGALVVAAAVSVIRRRKRLRRAAPAQAGVAGAPDEAAPWLGHGSNTDE